MQNFLREFAELLRKHDVNIEATERTKGYECYCDGIEFQIWGQYNDGEKLRDACTVKTSKYPDAEELLTIANNRSEPTARTAP